MGGESSPLSDNERFEIKSRLGAGAMGVVYRARDRERNVDVALKLLRKVDPAAIYRFKREFRALADVVHPNLVPLYELVSTGDQWFFTMELIVGTDFLTTVRGVSTDPLRLVPLAAPAAEEDSGSDASADTASSLAPTRELRGPPPGSSDEAPRRLRRPHVAPLARPDQFQRLRSTLIQLVDGVRALHRAGQLHRDIKPSNVMVTPEGRVVLLDFGVVAAMAEQDNVQSTAHIIGTPVYMAPEQGEGLPLSEASDWYAVGVMMYEALAGRVPFEGSLEQILAAKRLSTPLRPSTRGALPPPDLEELCLQLLQRDPDARPSGREIRHKLGALATSPLPIVRQRATAGRMHLIGREHELEILHAAFDRIAGKTVCVHLSGGSGVGKSALAREFLASIAAEQQVVVLEGRCYERESVPYKALDSLVDSLAHYLADQPHDLVAELLPEEMHALARLFPALGRVEAVIDSAALAPETYDPYELRRTAFGVLRELLSRLAARRPLVLHLDDLQWGDRDSAALLADVLRPPDAPPLMLIAAYRIEDAETSPFLRAFLPAQLDAISVLVEPLDANRARDMAALLLVDADDTARAQTDAIARESAGNPFFITELVQVVRAAGHGGGALPHDRSVSLEELLRTRLRSLPEEATRLLEVVAVAGQPIPQGLAMQAAALDVGARSALAHLRNARLVWTRGARAQDAVEMLHDRMRQAVIAELAPDALRACHVGIARALEDAGDADPEALATHLEGAGQDQRAATCYGQAADQAMDALAFDRAAALYRRALELGPASARAKPEAWAKLGDALSNAGQAAAAADAFLRATEKSKDESTALKYRLRAAEAHLHCGQIDTGVEGLLDVAASVGIDAPDTPRGALLSLVARRAWLRLRGLRFQPRAREELDPRTLAQLEICATASVSYGMFDPIRGLDFQTRSVLLALRAGEPSFLARAMVAEACYTASVGRRGERRGRLLMSRARELAEASGDAASRELVLVGQAVLEYLLGCWEASRAAGEQALALLRERSTSLAWELENVQLYHLWSLFYLGRIGELIRIVPDMLIGARARGDLFGVANLCTGLPNVVWLAENRVDEARRVARDAMTQWSMRGFHLLHYRELVTLTNAALYDGDGRAALEPVLERWPALKRSLLLRVAVIRLEGTALRARCHLAAAASGYDTESRLRTADRDARRVVASGEPWAIPMGLVIRGGVAVARRQEERARDLFEAAVNGFAEQGMEMHAAAARRRLGLLLGGDRGAELLRAADTWMEARGIARPERFTAMLAP